MSVSTTTHVNFGRVDAPSAFKLMAYDVQPSKGYNPGENPFYVTLQRTDGDEIQGLWNALAEWSANGAPTYSLAWRS